MKNILLKPAEIPPPQQEFTELDKVLRNIAYFGSKIKPDGLFLKEYIKAFETYKNATHKLISVLEHENMYLSISLADLQKEYALTLWQLQDYSIKMQNVVKFYQSKIKELQDGRQ